MATSPFITSVQADKKIQDSYSVLEQQIDIANAGSDLGLLKLTDTPPPTGKHRGDVQTAGTYTNFGGIVFTQPELDNNYGYIYVDEGVSSKVLSVKPIPVADGEIENGNLKAVNGDKIYNALVPFDNLLSKNYIDDSIIDKGSLNAGGTYITSNNQIYVPYFKVPDELKGKEVCYSGFGNITTSTCAVRILNASNVEVLKILGTSTIIPKIVFTIPIDADVISLGIANVLDIGLTPQDNAYIGVLMLNLGNERPIEYFSLLNPKIKGSNITEQNNLIFTNKITENGTGAVPSSEIFKLQKKVDDTTIKSFNLISLSDFKKGYFSASTHAYVTSDNWLCVNKTNINADIVEMLSVGDTYITIDGGGKVPASANIVSFFNSSNVFISGFTGSGEATNYPITIKIPTNARSWGFTIANVIGIGLTPTNNIYTNFQVVLGTEIKPVIPTDGYYINAKRIFSEEIRTDYENDITVNKISNNEFQIYYKIGSRYFMVKFIHYVNATVYTDCWKLDEGYTCERVGENSFTNLTKVILTGVYENAIYTSGAGYTDALGSIHGNETFNNMTFMLDDVVIDNASTNGWYYGSMVNITYNGNLTNPSNTATVAKTDKIWRIHNGKLNIKNKIKWLTTLGITYNSYTSMCSVLRKSGENQITTTALSNDYLIPQNVAEAGFTTPIYSDRFNPERTDVIIWGSDFRAQISVKKRMVKKADGTILPYGYSDAGMYVQNTELYNKVYGSFGSDTVENNDYWNIETDYIFN